MVHEVRLAFYTLCGLDAGILIRKLFESNCILPDSCLNLKRGFMGIAAKEIDKFFFDLSQWWLSLREGRSLSDEAISFLADHFA
jgi:hypothetical protein